MKYFRSLNTEFTQRAQKVYGACTKNAFSVHKMGMKCAQSVHGACTQRAWCVHTARGEPARSLHGFLWSMNRSFTDSVRSKQVEFMEHARSLHDACKQCSRNVHGVVIVEGVPVLSAFYVLTFELKHNIFLSHIYSHII